MLLRTFSFCLLLALAVPGIAQTEGSKERRHQFAVNTSLLVDSIFNPGDPISHPAAPAFQYKFIMGHWAARLGFTGQYEFRNIEVKSDLWRTDFHVGFEYRANLIQKLKLIAGAEGMIDIDKVTARFDGVKSKSIVYEWGGAGILGVHYDISNRFAVFTESKFLVSREQTVNKTDIPGSTFFPGGSDVSKDTRPTALELTVPTVVYFVFKI